jgi:UDP-glucose 4-epimerase
MKVLITGAAGEIAPGIIQHLANYYELILLDLKKNEQLKQYSWQTGSVLDPGFLKAALQGVQAIVNLAVFRKHKGQPASTDQFFDINVKGLFVLLETAAEAGIKKIIHMGSTAPVVGHWYGGGKITVESPYTTTGRYSLTKALQETICEHASRNWDMQVAVLRPSNPCEGANQNWYQIGLIDTGDLGEACRLAIEATDLKPYEVFHVVATEEARDRSDAERTEKLLGFRAQHDFSHLK